MRMLTKMTMAQLMMIIIFASKLKTLHNIFEWKEMRFDTSEINRTDWRQWTSPYRALLRSSMRAPFSCRASFSLFFCYLWSVFSLQQQVSRPPPETATIPAHLFRHHDHIEPISFFHTFHHVFLRFILFIRSLCFISDLPGSTSRQIGGRRRAQLKV